MHVSKPPRRDAETISSVIREINTLTERNQATDAVIVLARALGMHSEVTALYALKALHAYLQEMPLGLIEIRPDIRKKGLASARRKVDAATYRRLDAAF